MGIFQDTVELINRTSKPLNVRFDGQDMVLQPNYSATGERLKGVKNMVPKIVVPFAKNQNVLMGSEDAIDPSDFKFLVAVKGSKDSDSYQEQSGAPARVSLESMLDDPNSTIMLRGKVQHRAFDAVVAAPGGGVFDTPGAEA
jgi:hypothetical protein